MRSQAYPKMCTVRVYYSACGGMFWGVMRLNRTLHVGFALLLTLMLPLQGYAAMPGCGQPDHTNSSTDSSAANSLPALLPALQHSMQHHCARGSTVTHHHGCGNCCGGAAIALMATGWIAPLVTAPGISVAVLGSPPTVTLDRLDRPPRLILA
jgi:hypothetical protein